MSAYTPLIKVDQTDNGKTIHIVDQTAWDNTAATGVTNVKIDLTIGTTTVVMVNAAPSGQHQNDLVYDLTNEDFSGSDIAFDDGAVTITYTLTVTAPDTITVGTFEVFLDYNSKLYTLTLAKDVPYNLGARIAYNSYVEYSALVDTLYKGMVYSAAVGQIQKAEDILETLNNLIIENPV